MKIIKEVDQFKILDDMRSVIKLWQKGELPLDAVDRVLGTLLLIYKKKQGEVICREVGIKLK